MRLVDADKLLDILDVMIVGHKSASDVYDVVDSMPTVDAVPVVRCKDCRFFRRYGFKLEYAECVNFDFYDTTEDGYCCWAERREDDNK